MNQWRPIGVIGGMGPAATADFLARLVVAVGAARDADHPRVFIDCNPHVPDRNEASAGQGAAPGAVLAAMAQGLVAQGAEVLAMPCNAAHGWADAIVAATPARFVSMIDAAVAAAVAHGATRVGIMAVGATLDARLYQDRLAAAGIASLDCDRAVVQPLVTAIKAGDTGPAVRAALAAEAARLAAAGAEAVIAACTEIPLVLGAADVPVAFIDATAALVAATLVAANQGLGTA
ncbi:MAG: aspartate/glutamate racemase family protein [Polymorphobacter sp.]